MEKLSEENKKLKSQCISISEEHQLKFVSEYENKSFKSQLDLVKIHFKSFINMFTYTIDHMINRCISTFCDEETK